MPAGNEADEPRNSACEEEVRGIMSERVEQGERCCAQIESVNYYNNWPTTIELVGYGPSEKGE